MLNILSIPIAAVTAREDELETKKKEYNKKAGKEEDSKNTEKETELKEYVFLQQADSVVMKQVKTGIQDDAFIEIKEGITDGATIVIAPYEAISKKLKAGTKVKVVKEEDLYEDTKKAKAK